MKRCSPHSLLDVQGPSDHGKLKEFFCDQSLKHQTKLSPAILHPNSTEQREVEEQNMQVGATVIFGLQ